MNRKKLTSCGRIFISTALALTFAGCQSEKPRSADSSVPPPPTPSVAAVAPAASSVVNAPPTVRTVIRIKAGAPVPWTDSEGHVWAADQGFDGGDIAERPDATVTNTAEPGIYRAEHYGMNSFSQPLANGSYLVKLHFAETFEGIEGPGQRVFSFNVQGHDFKDFDVWAKAGGPLKAYVESVPVDVTNGKLLITFTTQVENPQVNGIEIIPQP